MSVAKILLGVTGGIAAYKACDLTRLLVKAGHEVVPVVTAGAERFVCAETFHALARRPAGDDPYPHLARADLLVIAPLTANTLAKLAHGLADNVLTEAALAHRGPVLLAPAMNPRMWAHPATRANVEALVTRGVELIGPDEGELAEGEWGVGRMAEPEEIFALVQALLGEVGPLAGKHVLVSAGGTREPIDSVRFVGNRSSGRMGVALAEEADEADVVLMAAAPADYAPSAPRADKRPKDERVWTLELEPTTDVMRELGQRRRDAQVLVAFGADHGPQGLERKRAMLEAKSVDLVVFNDVGGEAIGFDSEENSVTLVSRAGERTVDRAPKQRIAAAIVDEVERLLADGR